MVSVILKYLFNSLLKYIWLETYFLLLSFDKQFECFFIIIQRIGIRFIWQILIFGIIILLTQQAIFQYFNNNLYFFAENVFINYQILEFKC